MSMAVRNLNALAAGIWPRVAGFSNTPSLLVVALVANLVALIPTVFRIQKENLSWQFRMPAYARITPVTISSASARTGSNSSPLHRRAASPPQFTGKEIRHEFE